MNGYIYIITHNDSGKCYIGRTVKPNPYHRINDHLNGRGSKVLMSAIKSHGKDNFSTQILHKDIPINDLNWLERHCIAIFNSMVPDGYNLKQGGDNQLHSEETKEQMRRDWYVKNGGMTGKKHREESKRMISESNKGQTRSAETRKGISKSKKGIPSPKRGKLLNGIEFRKWRESLGLSRNKLGKQFETSIETIRLWENESIGISKKSIDKFKIAFGFDPTEQFKKGE